MKSDPDPLRELNKRRQILRASIKGEVSNFLRNYVKADLSQTVSDHQSQRIHKALSEKIILYPEARGIYMAASGDEIYVISLDPASCTCSDFMYNCDYQSGECCKHIWKLRAMIHIGGLPSHDSLPNLWTLAGIQNDLQSVNDSDKDLSQLKSGLIELQTKVARTEWYNVDYKDIYTKWHGLIDSVEL